MAVVPHTSNGQNGHAPYTLDDLDQASRIKGKLLHASDLHTIPPAEPLIERVLYKNTLSQIFGMPGHGKSYLCTDIGLSISQFGNVVYIAAEAVEDYQARVAAWCAHHKTGPGGLYFWPEPVNLFDRVAIDAFLLEVRSIEPTLIILDPLASCMVGHNESSTEDMTIAVDALNYIRRQTLAAVLVCHHAGWNDTHERGSTALRAASRVVMKLSNNDGLLTLTCEKTNHGKPFDPRYFQLIPAGDNVVPLPTSKITQRDAPITQKQIDILDALNLSIFADGASFTQLVEHLSFPKSTMNRSLTKLKDHGYITQEGRGTAQRYKITTSGEDVLLAQEADAVSYSLTHPTTGNANAELALNWSIKTEAIRSASVQHQNTVESGSSAEFRASSALVPSNGSSSVPPPSLKGRNNGTTEQNDGKAGA